MFFTREDILKIQNTLFILGTGWGQQGSQMCSSRISCAYAEKVRSLCEQTNNVTHQHKAEVIALISIEEVKAYDIIKDYTKNQL